VVFDIDKNAMKVYSKSVLGIHDHGLELLGGHICFQWSDISIVYVDSVVQIRKGSMLAASVGLFALFWILSRSPSTTLIAIILLFAAMVFFVFFLFVDGRVLGLVVVHNGVKCFFPSQDTKFLETAAEAILHKQVGIVCDFKTGKIRYMP